MKKKIYITPQLEEIHLNSECQLLAGTDGGHYGGNPRDIPDDDDDDDYSKINRVGYSIDLWSDDEDVISHDKPGHWK